MSENEVIEKFVMPTLEKTKQYKSDIEKRIPGDWLERALRDINNGIKDAINERKSAYVWCGEIWITNEKTGPIRFTLPDEYIDIIINKLKELGYDVRRCRDIEYYRTTSSTMHGISVKGW